MSESSAQDRLASALHEAARAALGKLFAEHPESFYYVTLVTTGEAHAPVLSAWSREALDAAARAKPHLGRAMLKWSYADSPYLGFGEELFAQVRELFSRRPPMTPSLARSERAAEYDLRLGAMERAMARLDEEGLFGRGAARERIVVAVEVMPPDRTNTERAKRLNPGNALREWLGEAAEE